MAEWRSWIFNIDSYRGMPNAAFEYSHQPNWIGVRMGLYWLDWQILVSRQCLRALHFKRFKIDVFTWFLDFWGNITDRRSIKLIHLLIFIISNLSSLRVSKHRRLNLFITVTKMWRSLSFFGILLVAEATIFHSTVDPSPSHYEVQEAQHFTDYISRLCIHCKFPHTRLPSLHSNWHSIFTFSSSIALLGRTFNASFPKNSSRTDPVIFVGSTEQPKSMDSIGLSRGIFRIYSWEIRWDYVELGYLKFGLTWISSWKWQLSLKTVQMPIGQCCW